MTCVDSAANPPARRAPDWPAPASPSSARRPAPPPGCRNRHRRARRARRSRRRPSRPARRYRPSRRRPVLSAQQRSGRRRAGLGLQRRGVLTASTRIWPASLRQQRAHRRGATARRFGDLAVERRLACSNWPITTLSRMPASAATGAPALSAPRMAWHGAAPGRRPSRRRSASQGAGAGRTRRGAGRRCRAATGAAPRCGPPAPRQRHDDRLREGGCRRAQRVEHESAPNAAAATAAATSVARTTPPIA